MSDGVMGNMLQITDVTDHTLLPEGRVSGDGAFWRQRVFRGWGRDWWMWAERW